MTRCWRKTPGGACRSSARLRVWLTPFRISGGKAPVAHPASSRAPATSAMSRAMKPTYCPPALLATARRSRRPCRLGAIVGSGRGAGSRGAHGEHEPRVHDVAVHGEDPEAHRV